MIPDISKIVTEERWILVFLPPATLGYLFVLKGNFIFIYWAVLSSILPAFLSEVIFSKPDEEASNFAETALGQFVFLLGGGVWVIGYLLGLYQSWVHIERGNLILVTLFLSNVVAAQILLYGTGGLFYREIVL